ncbi:MAG: hemerythrin domain-containing protein [Planctomycetota bacterium]
MLEKYLGFVLPRLFIERITIMAKTHHSSNRWALTGLFKRITLGEDPKLLQNEASQLAKNVSSDDIASAQQALIDEGYSSDLVEKIAAAFILMGLRKENGNATEAKLPDSHILQKILNEHALLRCYLADLVQIADEINHLDCLSDMSSEFRRLAHTIDYFYHFKRHIEREEDIIFPYLKKFGWKGLCRADEDEHRKILADINNLVVLLSSFGNFKFVDFNGYLQKIIQHFIPMVQDHLSYEEDILWPIALVVLDDAKTWETIKAFCDEFEY